MDKPRKTYSLRRSKPSSSDGDKTSNKHCKKGMPVIKELPQADYRLSHDSIDVEINDTFDKLMAETKNTDNDGVKDDVGTEKAPTTSKDLDTFEISIDNSLSVYKKSIKQEALSDTYSFINENTFSQPTETQYSNIFDNNRLIERMIVASTPQKHCSSTPKSLPDEEPSLSAKCSNVEMNDSRIQTDKDSFMDIDFIECTPQNKLYSLAKIKECDVVNLAKTSFKTLKILENKEIIEISSDSVEVGTYSSSSDLESEQPLDVYDEPSHVSKASSNSSDRKNKQSTEVTPKKDIACESMNGILDGNSVKRIYKRRHTVGKTLTSVFNAERQVLQMCNQSQAISFDDINDDVIKHVPSKIGEGVYSEVYRCKSTSETVIKIMPIEGDQIVNGEKQKSYEEILSELIVSKELSDLRQRTFNKTCTFANLKNIYCVYGKYPERLLKLWLAYDEEKGSENDCPDMFDDDQHYVILQFANAGEDMERYTFNNAQQALSAFYQIVMALAVAENVCYFEHRDLHWSNILITTVKKDKLIAYTLNGVITRIPSYGIQVCIIDYTLSRMLFNDRIIYNDLSKDALLFTGTADYQFEVYRKMKSLLLNSWESSNPRTNVYWLQYVVDKLITTAKYKKTNTKVHSENMILLDDLRNALPHYGSCILFLEKIFENI